MRLARGSGTAGLAAPRPVHVMADGRVHLRPLLTLKKSFIADSLRAARVRWCEDATNVGVEFFRNRVRQQVIPVWEAAAGERDALVGAALSRELLEEDDAALGSWLIKLNPVTTKGALSLRRLAQQPRALVRRALHHWIGLHMDGATLSRQAFGALLNDVMRARMTRHSLGRGVFAKIGKRQVTFERQSPKLSN